MYVEDVIKNMEDVWGMKKGYDKNPVAVKKFHEVLEKLNKAGISELTPDNRERFQKITEEYITDRLSKSGTKFGWANRESKDVNGANINSNYKMDIDENGNLIEEGITTMSRGGVKITETKKDEYNVHGLGLRSERETDIYDFNRHHHSATKSTITRNSDLVTANIEVSNRPNIDAVDKSVDTEDIIKGGTILSNNEIGSSISRFVSSHIDSKSLDVSNSMDMYNSMKSIREGRQMDTRMYSLDGKEKDAYGRYDIDTSMALSVDKTHDIDFDINYARDEAFRKTAKDMGLRPDLEKRVKTNKLKEIYDKIKDKIKSVANKFTKKTKDDKSQDMQY